MDWIDHRQLPPSAGGYSALFLRYLYEFDDVRQFYPGNFRENSSYEAVMRAIDMHQPDRSALTEVLKEQNPDPQASPRTKENIELLGRSTTYAVVTGQQVGLFGGPMYTVYKTLTTIILAEKLAAKFPGKSFVPVFWIEGEDHDFAEMNHTSVFDRANGVTPVQYLPGGIMPEKNVGAVGEMVFDDSIGQVIDTLDASLPPTEFTAPLIARLRECYAPGSTFRSAFTAWMRFLFGDRGLVFLSPHHPRLKQLLSPLFVKELETFPHISQLVITRSAELEQRYHAQIKTKSINLFMFHKGGRYLIEPRETDFSLKGTRAFFTRDELMAIARETPELLSPNVVLRPLCQDTLLPTVSYVGGPSEVAYFAQLQSVYEDCGTTEPVIYPRAGATLLPGNLVRAMEKYDLELPEFFGNVDTVTNKVVAQIADIKLDVMFEELVSRLHGAIGEVKFGLNEVDPTLLGAVENLTSKIDTNVGVLREKSIAAQKRRNETAVRQIERAVAGVLPGGVLQEREINAVSFLNRYGVNFISWLFDHLDITGFKHQILAP